MAKEQSRASEEKFERKAGVYILITVVVVVAILFAIGKEKKIFESKYRLITTFEHGANIDNNTGVTLAGLKVGNVTDVYINKENKIDVEMSIQREYQEFIRDDSVARLVFSLLKGSVIDITFGSQAAAVLEDGGRIQSTETEDIADKVSVNVILPKSDEFEDIIKNKLPSLIEKVDNVFGIVDNLTGSLGSSTSNLHKLVDNFWEFSVKLNEGRILDRGEALLANTADLTKDLKGITNGLPDLFERFSLLINESNELLSNLNTISAGLKGQAPDLPDAIESVRELMYDLNDVIDASKKSFLLKKHIKKRIESPVMINEGRRDLLIESD